MHLFWRLDIIIYFNTYSMCHLIRIAWDACFKDCVIIRPQKPKKQVVKNQVAHLFEIDIYKNHLIVRQNLECHCLLFKNQPQNVIFTKEICGFCFIRLAPRMQAIFMI